MNDAQVRALIDAMEQILDDMGPLDSGKSVCLATKAMARVAFEPFLDAEAREFFMPIDRATEVLRDL